MHLLEQRLPISAITVMVQKEAATRLCAPMGSRDCSAITFAVQYYAIPKLLFSVSRGSFLPAPNVDSAVIRLDLRQARPAGVDSDEAERYLFALVKAAFSQRRKTLPNPLSGALHLPKATIIAALEAVGLSPTARAENLTVEQYIALANRLRESKA
jgi:16S rRNA (adenine1518-N6/adenine1519-N6)-dimethyltransferase